MGIPLRKLWANKPKQWGPAKSVQRSLFHNLESIYGIDHQTCALALPCWRPGDQIDYSKNKFLCENKGVTFKNNELFFTDYNTYLQFTDNILPAAAPIPCTLAFTIKAEMSPIHAIFSNNFPSYHPLFAAGLVQLSGSAYKLFIFSGGYVYSDAFTLTTKATTFAISIGTDLSVQFFGNGTSIGSGTITVITGATTGSSCIGTLDGVSNGYKLNGSLRNFFIFSEVIKNNTLKKLTDFNSLWQRVAPISYFFPVGGSGGAETITITKAYLSLTPKQLLITSPINISKGDLYLSAKPIYVSEKLNIDTASLTLSHKDIFIVTNGAVVINAGSISSHGKTVKASERVEIITGQLELAAKNLMVDDTVAVEPGVLTLTEKEVTASNGSFTEILKGALSMSGKDYSLSEVLNIGKAALTLIGKYVDLGDKRKSGVIILGKPGKIRTNRKVTRL